MSIKQTIRNVVTGSIVALAFVITPATPALAIPGACIPTEDALCADGTGIPERTNNAGSGSSQSVNTTTNNGCEVDTAIISCENVDTSKDGVENTGLWSLLLTAINILTAGVGVLALGGIVYGAVLYSAAGGNPEQVKKARTVFTNVVIGIVAFAAMYALLNFIVPGGVFN